ncbi:MAG: hypothetical protein ACFB10_02685 [Salibacteraceae bacterium]
MSLFSPKNGPNHIQRLFISTYIMVKGEYCHAFALSEHSTSISLTTAYIGILQTPKRVANIADT